MYRVDRIFTVRHWNYICFYIMIQAQFVLIISQEKRQKSYHHKKSAYLGTGGYIYDEPTGIFEKESMVNDWINVTK